MAPKRKRAAAAASDGDLDVPIPQPSSRDASGEDAHDSALEEVSNAKHKQDGASTAQSSSSKRAVNGRKKAGSAKDIEMPSPKRPRSSRNQVPHSSETGDEMPTSTTQKAAFGVDTSAGHSKEESRMDSPPRAGIVDPVGYHTNPPPEGRTVRVYADGVFDLFHLGHMRQLEQAKTSFPNTRLIVGVTGDAETHRRKGLTVLSARERAETVRHCRWVDEVVEDCPWVVSADFLTEHNLDYVAHDDIPYGAAEGDDIYKPIKEEGKFLVTQRTEGVSTTGIITKIVRDYEQYISRQLKRGTSRQELNVSWLKKNELELKRHVSELRNSIRTNWSTTGQELGKELRSLWVNSRPASPAPGRRSDDRRRSQAASESGYFSPNGEQVERGDKSPPLSAVSHLSHLDVPRSPTVASGIAQAGVMAGAPTQGGLAASPSTSIPVQVQGESADFARGYSLGLVGGIRSWMMRNRRNVMSRPASPGAGGSSGTSSEEDVEDVEEEDLGRKRGRKRARVSFGGDGEGEGDESEVLLKGEGKGEGGLDVGV